MKRISYKVLTSEINHGTEENPNVELVFTDMEIRCSTEESFNGNYPIAEKEAYPGTIDVSGEFDPVPVTEPTADEVLNAMLGVM